ncbi:WXG100 family type VII secretion target [Streptomyces sp. NPDC020681]|uniref:WXG100 family type VII secretion target n=1 Tax=Streptomyces sp. NPDC020681 TaxID=3365083 RepID=UPI0037AD92AA
MSDNFSDGFIYVDYAHMNNAADDLIAQTRAIATTLTNLEMELQELIKSWEGEDRDIYTKKQEAWANAVQAMENMLMKHVELLNDISGSYKYSENALSQLWSGVQIG